MIDDEPSGLDNLPFNTLHGRRPPAVRDALKTLQCRMPHSKRQGIDSSFHSVGVGAQILRSPLPPNLEIPEHVRRLRHFNVGPPLTYKLRDEAKNDSWESGTEVKTKTHFLQGFGFVLMVFVCPRRTSQ